MNLCHIYQSLPENFLSILSAIPVRWCNRNCLSPIKPTTVLYATYWSCVKMPLVLPTGWSWRGTFQICNYNCSCLVLFSYQFCLFKKNTSLFQLCFLVPLDYSLTELDLVWALQSQLTCWFAGAGAIVVFLKPTFPLSVCLLSLIDIWKTQCSLIVGSSGQKVLLCWPVLCAIHSKQFMMQACRTLSVWCSISVGCARSNWNTAPEPLP